MPGWDMLLSRTVTTAMQEAAVAAAAASVGAALMLTLAWMLAGLLKRE